MNTQTILTLLAIAIAFLWGYIGWMKGAVVEVRGLLVTYFAVLVAMRFWHPVWKILEDILGSPALSAAVVFCVLFLGARLLVSYAMNNKARAYKPADDNTPDKAIGAASGFASGLLMGSTLALLVTLASVGEVADASKPAPKRIEQLPIALFRFIEKDLAHIPAEAGTLLPMVVQNPSNPSQTQLAWE